MSRTIKNEEKYVKVRKSEKAKLSKKYRDFKRGSSRVDFITDGSFKVEAIMPCLSVSQPVVLSADSAQRNDMAA